MLNARSTARQCRSVGSPFSSSGVRSRAPSRSGSVVVQATESVQELLERDRKLRVGLPTSVSPELETGSAPAAPQQSAAPADTGFRNRKQRQEERAKKAAAAAEDPNRPKTCKQAIDQGLAAFQGKQYQQAVDLFNLALELPGNGAYRLPDSPREYSCPSDAEENAALYNMACAYAQMGRKASALTCLEAILENDFTDFETIKTDPDLAPLKSMELDLLLLKYANPLAKVRSVLPFNQQKSGKSDKPWLMW